MIFNTETLGLSNTQAFLLGVLPYGLSALFEVPTGAWADKFGRAKIYRLGTVLYILSVASYIFSADFYVLLGFQVLGGLGLAMQSGGLEALVHDSITGPDKDAVYSKAHGRKMAILFTSRVLTVLLSGWLFALNPKLPFVVAVVTYLIGLAVSLFFTEVRVQTPSELSSYRHIRQTLRQILAQPTLVIFFWLIVLYTFCSEALFALYQPYFQSISIDIGQFGVFYAIISFFSAVGALTVAALAKRHNAFVIVLLMMLAVLCTLAAMTLRLPALVYLAIIPSSVAFGFVITLQNTITQTLISSRHHATALSIASLSRTFAILISVIGLGVALDVVSVAAVNLGLVVITAFSLIPFIVGITRKSTV